MSFYTWTFVLKYDGSNPVLELYSSWKFYVPACTHFWLSTLCDFLITLRGQFPARLYLFRQDTILPIISVFCDRKSLSLFNMAESLHHLDLLLQLQAESFQETLERHVSMHSGFYNGSDSLDSIPHGGVPSFH